MKRGKSLVIFLVIIALGIGFIGVVSAVIETRTFSDVELGATPPASSSEGFCVNIDTGNKVCQLKGYDNYQSYTTEGWGACINDYAWDWNSGAWTKITDCNGGGRCTEYMQNLTCTRDTCIPLTSSNCTTSYPNQCSAALDNGCGTGTIDCSDACTGGLVCNSGSNLCVSAVVSHSCINTNQTIMKLYDSHNANASLWNYSGIYEICFNELFGRIYDKSVHNCSIYNDPILYLSSVDNSLSSLTNSAPYNVSVCFGNLTCRNVTSTISGSGLVAYYPLDGDANDVSGNENNGFPSDGTPSTETRTFSDVELGATPPASSSEGFCVNIDTGNKVCQLKGYDNYQSYTTEGWGACINDYAWDWNSGAWTKITDCNGGGRCTEYMQNLTCTKTTCPGTCSAVIYVNDPVRGLVASFDGTSYISVPDSASLDGMAGLTVCFWTKINVKSNWAYLLSKNNDSFSEGSYGIFMDSSSDQKLMFKIKTNNGEGSVISNNAQILNTWYHICGLYNGSEISLWQNGVKQTQTTPLTGNIFQTSYALNIGMSETSFNFNGSMDKIRIFNRALNPQEIQYEYNGIVPNVCNNDENLTLRLNANTNALMSSASDTTFPVQLCCKEKYVIDSISGNAGWQNMNGVGISNAQKDDNVKLVLNRGDVFNKNINYLIYKKVGGIWGWLFGDSKIGQFDSIGFLTWKANESGEFYFNATVEGFSDVYSSGILTVNSVISNVMPKISIVKPREYTNFVINNSGWTNIIPFEQNASDEDDLVDVTWDFADGTTAKFYNCNNGTSNCNTTHRYNSTYAGIRIVRATAKETTRGQSEYDLSKINVYKEGLILFVDISKPEYKNRIFLPGLFDVDGSQTHVANCSYNQASCVAAASAISKTCDEIIDNINPPNKIYCYKFAESSSANPTEARKFKFNWTIDGIQDIRYTNSSPFKIMFPKGGQHTIGLKIVFNMSA